MEKTARLEKLLEHLSSRQKEILYLYYVKGLSHQQIAEMLGINRNLMQSKQGKFNTIKEYKNVKQQIEEFRKFEQENKPRTKDWFAMQFPSPPKWFNAQKNYVHTTAIWSIVGYIVGLGDRHAANIMIDRSTGDIIHIDFGDCFEVNTDRLLFPEKIPFRLTRMIVAAFGIGGVDTEFRSVSERVLTVVRDNASSLASVLELFLLESNYSTLEKGMIKRTWDKMSGDDFPGRKGITPVEQVDLLIKEATDQYNLAHLYSGWSPLW